MVSMSVILQLFLRRESSGELRNKATNYHFPRHTYQFKPQGFWKQFLHPLLPVLSVCFKAVLSPDSLSSEKVSVFLIDCQKSGQGVAGLTLSLSAWVLEADGPLSLGLSCST